MVPISDGCTVKMQPDDIELSHKDSQRLARRQLLRLGAAGMPMVLTLKASAREVLVSQLRCVIVMPSRRRILIDSNGNAWIGTRDIDYRNGKGFKGSDIRKFKDHSETVYFGSVGSDLSDYIPSSCGGNSQCDDDDDDDDDDNGGWNWHASASDDFDALMNVAPSVTSDGVAAGVTYVSSWGGGDDDDDCDDSGWIDCGYNFFTINSNTTITPADYLGSNENWNYSGTKGLYVGLLVRFESLGMTGGSFPGISCVQSILQYINTN